MQVEQAEKFEDGDVWCSGTGEHIGTLDVASFNFTKQALHLQVYVNGDWYVYTLTAIEKLGDEIGAEHITR